MQWDQFGLSSHHMKCASCGERAGIPPSVAMSIVGHKTESIYRRYAIVDETMQREAAVRLDAWLADSSLSRSAGTVTILKSSGRLRSRTAARSAQRRGADLTP